MLGTFFDNLSTILNIDTAIIPNIISFFVFIIVVGASLRSGLSWQGILIIYVIVSLILTLLGIDSVFNMISLLEALIDEIGSLIF